ncbi:hypothetical protein ZWY2020_022943 [Hordeum vulgare]|nr:hypothetical protein ZWY2020_022943 [Hordeum vulgare]
MGWAHCQNARTKKWNAAYQSRAEKKPHAHTHRGIETLVSPLVQPRGDAASAVPSRPDLLPVATPPPSSNIGDGPVNRVTSSSPFSSTPRRTPPRLSSPSPSSDPRRWKIS